MEFERALFRVHYLVLGAGGLGKTRKYAELVLPWLTLCLVVGVAVLHCLYVGRSSCLLPLLQDSDLFNRSSAHHVPVDVVLVLSLVEGAASATPAPIWSHSTEAAAASIGYTLDQVVASYRFAFDYQVVGMPRELFLDHNFQECQLFMPTSCLASWAPARSVFSVFDAWDVIMVNELAYGFQSGGFLTRVAGENATTLLGSWSWSTAQVEATMPPLSTLWGLWAAVSRKSLILLWSVVNFALISSITGIYIRVVVSASAILMVPITNLLRWLRMSGVSRNMMTRSFRWIGVHMEILRRARHPAGPFFLAHCMLFVVIWFSYMCSTISWRFFLYTRGLPDSFLEQVFSMCYMLELYNMVFVRSIMSVRFFPKATCFLVVLLHFYVFCALHPFYVMAMSAACSGCLYLMFFCLNHFEETAAQANPFAHSTPTIVHPRAVYMPQLSPAWTIESAPLWTMFYAPEEPDTFPAEAMEHIRDEEWSSF